MKNIVNRVSLSQLVACVASRMSRRRKLYCESALRWLLPLGSNLFLVETWLQTIVLCFVGYLVYGDKIISSSTGRFHSGEGPNIAYSQ